MRLRESIYLIKDSFCYGMVLVNLRGCESVLDVGCGAISPIGNFKKSFYSEGIDIHEPSIQISKKNKIHDAYTIGDILSLEKYYKPKTFDAVVAMDLIEHLKKKDGIKLLAIMERIAKKRVIILTPHGFVNQGHLQNNSYQKHRSGWTVKDFKSRSYKVYGLRSFKFLRGKHATITFRPWIFWGLVAFFSEPFLYYFPIFSFDLFAVKHIDYEKNQ